MDEAEFVDFFLFDFTTIRQELPVSEVTGNQLVLLADSETKVLVGFEERVLGVFKDDMGESFVSDLGDESLQVGFGVALCRFRTDTNVQLEILD